MIKTVTKIVFRSWSALLCFEVVYKSVGFVIILPFLQFLLLFMLKAAGVSYLSQENIGVVLTRPFAIAVAFCAILIVAYYVYLEIVVLTYYCEKGWNGETVSVRELWKEGALRTFRIFYYKNLPVILITIPAIALSVFPLTNGALSRVQIPEFIMEFIEGNKLLLAFYVGAIVLLNFLFFFYVFGIPSVVLKGESFIHSWRTSKRLLQGKKLKTIQLLIGCFCVFGTIIFLIGAAWIFLTAVFTRLTFSPDEAKNMFQFYLLSWGRIGTIVAGVLGTVLLSAAVIVLYHRYQGHNRPSAVKSQTMGRILKQIAAICITFILLAFYSESEMGGNLGNTFDRSTKIVAHRAGAIFAPENTLAALSQAIKDGAHMAEIDIQQTKDQTLIVMHDSNFRRTAGVNRNVWDVDDKTVKTFEVGSFFSPLFAGERIPTLEQMLQLAKDRIQLMIELKATGYEQGLEKCTLNLVNKYHMKEQCVIASMNLDILRRIKEIDPDMKTVYISPILLIDSYNLDYVDGYSVETTSLTPGMVMAAHMQDKKLYAWTANSETTIKKILRSQADGLITDNPLLANYFLKERDENLFLKFLMEVFYP